MVNEDLTAKYKTALQKDPPNSMKNNEIWLQAQIDKAPETHVVPETPIIETDGGKIRQAQTQENAKKIEAHVGKIPGKLEEIPGRFLFGKKTSEAWLIKLGAQEKFGITIPEQDPQNPVHWAKVTIGNETNGVAVFFIAREESVLLPKSLYEMAMTSHVKKGRPHALLKRSVPKELQ